MKIIHTYYPVNQNLQNESINMMWLSCLLSLKNYGNITLYTNNETKKIVKDLGIPYTNIETSIFDNLEFNMNTFSIPKIVVFSQQKQPFIHIDLDTFLFNKISFDDSKKIYSTFNEGIESFVNSSPPFFFHALNGFYETYIKNVDKLIANQGSISEEFISFIRFSEIPNMSVFGGHNYELISHASKFCLDIYKKNFEFFDSYYYNACIAEQLFISTAIRMFSNYNYQYQFLYKCNPNRLSYTNDTFPLKICNQNQLVDEYQFNEKVFYSEDQFINSDYEFDGFLHLNGYKNRKEINLYIKNMLELKTK